MQRITEKQKNVIQLFNASEISVTEFVRRLAEDGIEVEELCPTPADAEEIMLAYDATAYIPVPRIEGAPYGSHAALQVIVLKQKVKTPSKSISEIIIVEIKGS